MRGEWTRRQVIGRGGAAVAGAAGLALAGLTGYAWPRQRRSAGTPAHPRATGSSQPAADQATAYPADVHHFVTRPDLRPPVVSTTPGGAPGGPPYIFVAPRAYKSKPVGQSGLMILDQHGRLVWFGPPLGGTPMNFARQFYRGQPVLTWSAGFVNKVGVTFGTSYIADSSYHVIATVKAGNGAETDLHEFNLTPQGTALITAHRKVSTDLTALGGPAKGSVYASIAQEVDVATGKVLFEWDSLDHVKLTESYQPLAGGTAANPYDYFHINSIALAPDGDLLISSRNTWTVYKVARPSGAVVWRMGGKLSDFTMGPGARFYWQHDVRMPQPGLLSVFDDGSSPPEEAQSRALLLNVDTAAMRVSLAHAYQHPAGLLADNQGSVQLLPDGRVFVGWGAEPYFSEFAADGQILLDGQFPPGIQSYRAYTFDWSGNPPGKPAVVAHPNPSRGSVVYVSWNGATGVARWVVSAGRHPGSLATAGWQRPTGFETAVTVTSEGPYFAVTAYDSHGRVLGRSQTVQRSAA